MGEYSFGSESITGVDYDVDSSYGKVGSSVVISVVIGYGNLEGSPPR